MSEYNRKFYARQMKGSKASAELIVPYIIRALSPIRITSVVDFGCGVGGWLAQFQEEDAAIRVLGMDFGEPEESQIQIPLRNYKKVNLSQKIALNDRFDLCISLEVAEHIPPAYADTFVDNLCAHADLILFSAAVPYQGGMEHVNEQPLSYWSQKFEQRRYHLHDIIRPYFWNNRSIEMWYRQNMVLFIKDSIDTEMCQFRNEQQEPMVDIILPEFFYSRTAGGLISRGYLEAHCKGVYHFLRKVKYIFIH